MLKTKLKDELISSMKEKNQLSFLLWTAAATALAFTGWRVLLNNFAVAFPKPDVAPVIKIVFGKLVFI